MSKANANSRSKTRLRFASQVFSEAVAIIALREVCRSIHEGDTPESIRQRIKNLIAVKAQAAGLNDDDFDSVVNGAHEVIEKADQALAEIMRKEKGK